MVLFLLVYLSKVMSVLCLKPCNILKNLYFVKIFLSKCLCCSWLMVVVCAAGPPGMQSRRWRSVLGCALWIYTLGREGGSSGQREGWQKGGCCEVSTKAWAHPTELSWFGSKGVAPSLSPGMDVGCLQGEGLILAKWLSSAEDDFWRGLTASGPPSSWENTSLHPGETGGCHSIQYSAVNSSNSVKG